MLLPVEQFTILIDVGIVREAGVFPIAVMTRSKPKETSELDVNLTLLISKIEAPVPDIEYWKIPQSGLENVNGEINKSFYA